MHMKNQHVYLFIILCYYRSNPRHNTFDNKLYLLNKNKTYNIFINNKNKNKL